MSLKVEHFPATVDTLALFPDCPGARSRYRAVPTLHMAAN